MSHGCEGVRPHFGVLRRRDRLFDLGPGSIAKN
jgi:hypothetical protein